MKELEDVEAVGSLWRSGHPEKELRLEPVDDSLVGAGSGPVRLVDDDVVERVVRDRGQRRLLRKRLDGREDEAAV